MENIVAKWFVSTSTKLTKHKTKKSAIALAKEKGGCVLRACECGCGSPSGKLIVSYPESK